MVTTTDVFFILYYRLKQRHVHGCLSKMLWTFRGLFIFVWFFFSIATDIARAAVGAGLDYGAGDKIREAGFGPDGIKKDSLAAAAMKIAAKTGFGSGLVGDLQKVGSANNKKKTEL